MPTLAVALAYQSNESKLDALNQGLNLLQVREGEEGRLTQSWAWIADQLGGG